MPPYRTRDASARTLHVSTDPPPTVAIVSPTPRAFTFPIDDDPRYSDSPASSPFQPNPKLTPQPVPASDSPPASHKVSPDAPQPPSVFVISPTPRAFTFPIDDPRFADSPSSSPFEPNLKSVPDIPPVVRPFSPTSSIDSDSSLSVLSSPTAPPPSQASSRRRRRSTASDIGERPPKKGDRDYIPRPENSFILFRRKRCEERQAAIDDDDGSSGRIKKQRQADLSKSISQEWKNLSPEERQYWEQLARERKKEHEAMYPHYVYRPQRSKGKKGKKGKARGPDVQETDTDTLSFLLPVSSPSRSLTRDVAQAIHGHGRRAASAPTPPPAYQAIQLPSVWMPSSPTSPTLIPRISGRAPAPQGDIPSPSESAPLTSYDYAPNDPLFMAPYQAHPGYDRNTRQQHDVYHNMYNHHQGMANGPLLHALSIPQRESDAPHTISPADTLTSPSSASSSDAYASPAGAQSGIFTPADTLRLLSVHAQSKDGADGGDGEDVAMPYGFWPTETLWANMEGLMPEDFNLGTIPPVEIGLSQFEAIPPHPGHASASQNSSSSLSGAWPPQFDGEGDGHANFARAEGRAQQKQRQERDVNDSATTAGGQNAYSAFAHDRMNW